MSVQQSLNNNSNMVVAEIINEINSTQPPGNYSQNTRATPIQRPQQPQQMRQQGPPQQMQQTQQQPQQMRQQRPPQQQRATPIRRPEPQQQPQQAQQRPPQQPQRSPPMRNVKSRTPFLDSQLRDSSKKKKVRFKEEVNERVIMDLSDSESDCESEDSEDIILKKAMRSKKEKRSKSLETSKPKPKQESSPKFLSKEDVTKNDLKETKGLYSKVIGFFTNDTKEPLLVLALVFAVSMPIVNKLMTRFLPFIMKYGEESLIIVGVKALVVALVFFTIKKLLL